MVSMDPECNLGYLVHECEGMEYYINLPKEHLFCFQD